MQRVKVLGINVDILDEEEMYERIFELSELDRCSQIVLLDVTLLMKAIFNKNLKNIINNSSLVIPVSKGMKNAISFLHKIKINIIDSNRIVIRVMSHLTDYNKIVSIVGGNKKSIKIVEKNIKDSFPGLRLMGVHHAKYKKKHERLIITNLQKISPSLLVVSMNRPKQEFWISKYKNQLKRGVIIGSQYFINYISEKFLSPIDLLFINIGRSFKSIISSPFVFLRNSSFVFFLIISKIFGLDKKR